jgi:general secretion pathway protein C
MDLAKNVAQWRDFTPEQWMAQANRVLPPVVVLVLIILIAYQAAGLTWRLLDAPADQDIVPAISVAAGGNAGPRASGPLEALTGWHPFGQPPSPDEASTVLVDDLLDAEETTLNLTLHGLAQAQELPEPGGVIQISDKGLAVISSGRGQQKVYHIGDTIEDASGAKLDSVFVDRVFLDRGGRRERLSYPEPDEQVAGGPRLNSNVAARAPRAAPPCSPITWPSRRPRKAGR